jgi:branched-chain amino acid transport system permease protein
VTEFFGTLPGGLVTGAVYALLAMGLVFTYKATRVPNFAYGAMATLVAFFHYDLVAGRDIGVHLDVLALHVDWSAQVQLSFWAAVPVSLAFAALVGLVIERLVIRPFARAPMVVHIIVTLGLGLLLSALTQQLFGADQLIVANDNAVFPRTPAFSIAGVNVSWERLGVLLIVVSLSALTYWFFRSTRTGLAIRATATDRDVASLLGVSARRLSVVSWVSGSMVAGIAGIALASLVVASDPNLLLLLTIKAFAAAIVGGMISFPVAVGAGFAIGLGEEWARHYLVAHDAKLWQGAPELLTLGAVIVVLALRPRWIFRGLRDDEDAGVVGRPGAEDSFLARAIDPAEAYRAVRAAVGWRSTAASARRWKRSGRVIAVALACATVALPYIPFIDRFYLLPANLSLVLALVLLSFVVLVGWLGQVSLAQGAFVAVGGAGAAITANALGLPFPFPILGGIALAVPVALLLGLPALRLRGLHLAVATLAFGVAAERAIVPRFIGTEPLRLPASLDTDVARYYLFLGLTIVAFVFAWRISRTRVGRSFAAIRDSEIVATAYGIRPVRVKLTGFVVAGAIAALAGTMVSYQLGSVRSEYASVAFSITWLANAVVAGIGSLGGPLIGAFAFGLYPELDRGRVEAASISFWPQIFSSALLLVIMAVHPGGLASMSRFVRRRVSAYDEGASDDLAALTAAAADPESDPAPEKVLV